MAPDGGPTLDPTRLSMRKWYLMSGGWSLLLIPSVLAAVTSDHALPVRALLAAAVVAYAACYVLALFQAMTRQLPLLSAALIVVMTLLWASTVLVGAGLYSVSYLIVTVVVLVQPPWSGLGAAIVCGVAAAVEWFVAGGIVFGDLIGMIAISMAMVAMFGLIRVNTQLREAREELAGLAVTAERERIARDLHDVLGHSLTTITVKAGLARRLLERGDHERAGEEVTDVERLGRQALAEVRSTVSANRVASLARELAGAREALRAAEIEADLPVAVDNVPPERQEVFAYVVREGITNAIRHSGASRCSIRLTPTSVEVVDDGVGSPAGTTPGNGISGLTERLATLGGWIDAGPTPTGGYRLRAECLPVRSPARRSGLA